MRAGAEGLEDAAAEAGVAAVAEAVAGARAIRVRIGLRGGGLSMIRIFHRVVHCLCLRRERRLRAAVRMTMRARVAEDAVVRQGLSLA
jgi:hypothetical protein